MTFHVQPLVRGIELVSRSARSRGVPSHSRLRRI